MTQGGLIRKRGRAGGAGPSGGFWARVVRADCPLRSAPSPQATLPAKDRPDRCRLQPYASRHQTPRLRGMRGAGCGMWWYQLDRDQLGAAEQLGVVRHSRCREPDPAAGRRRKRLVRDPQGHPRGLAGRIDEGRLRLAAQDRAGVLTAPDIRGCTPTAGRTASCWERSPTTTRAVGLQVADSWSAQTARQIAHARLLHPPTSVVGDRISAWQGQTHEGRALVPVWVVMWAHGNAIGGVFLFGNKASAAQAFRIAAAQDARLTAA